ncbi:translation factor GUF1, mitochondrial-like isoform X2 [Halichondria panicea]|uniref:translation factor GUF1, mitochondrial-like isoform X2 n=1 Tax=Halichondria panicea TaxID=6063 RepID=UPI00312B717F
MDVVRFFRLLRNSVSPGYLKSHVVLQQLATFVRRFHGVHVGSLPPERIRNFGIIAHVDHGKSTLADRLLESTGVIDPNISNQQVLDRLPVERERGITVKAQTATMFYQMQRGGMFMMNLIDTPGHVDFSYEVSRSLAACQGVLLVVDGQQGVQAQTVANFLLASEAGLTVIPVINKIDLSHADIPKVTEQMRNAFGFNEADIIQVSAKIGTGIPQLLPAIVERVPSPPGIPSASLRMLLFDSWFNHYKGVVCLVAIVDGCVSKGDVVQSAHTGLSYEVAEVGILQTKEVKSYSLHTGQVGYMMMGMKNVKDAFIGDTFHHAGTQITPLPGFTRAKPMVFAGVFPMDSNDFPYLRTAVDKLALNDSSVSVYPDSSVALGQGWRLGFLGLLHMDVFRQRLEEEYDASVIVTSPSVSYKAILRTGEEVVILTPSQFPARHTVEKYLEPVVLGTLVCPLEYLGKMLNLSESRRGMQQEMLYLDETRVLLKYIMPLSEVVLDFYDAVKSESSGYASFDYEDFGFQPASLVKVDLLLNQNPVDALAVVVHEDKAFAMAKTLCEKLKNVIHRVKALRKNVTAKCYGGDITRKMKLLRKQKEGKLRLKVINNVELSKEAFVRIIRK